jgi:hypothetical protein
MKNNGSRAPLGDKTNTTKEGYRMQHAIEYSIVFPMYMLYQFFKNYFQLMLKTTRGKRIELNGMQCPRTEG